MTKNLSDCIARKGSRRLNHVVPVTEPQSRRYSRFRLRSPRRGSAFWRNCFGYWCAAHAVRTSQELVTGGTFEL
ncbi:hypothetical protein RSAG8_13314, partial [Rhizoctonia solani AG-8 WAC10335]